MDLDGCIIFFTTFTTTAGQELHNLSFVAKRVSEIAAFL